MVVQSEAWVEQVPVVEPVEPAMTQEPAPAAVPAAGGTYQVHPGAVVQVACVTRLPQPVATPQSAGQETAVSLDPQKPLPQVSVLTAHGLDAWVE